MFNLLIGRSEKNYHWTRWIKYSTFNIQYIKKPSEEVQIMVVQRNGNSIEYIEESSEQVQKNWKYLIQFNGIDHIRNISSKWKTQAN